MAVIDPNGNVTARPGADLLQQHLPGGLLICTEGTQIEMLPI
jgi:hypothetical protein